MVNPISDKCVTFHYLLLFGPAHFYLDKIFMARNARIHRKEKLSNNQLDKNFYGNLHSEQNREKHTMYCEEYRFMAYLD